jgi:FixJ family two-component response regulator
MKYETPVVLIVDDDPAVCSSMRRLLKAEGFEVRTFSTPGDLFAHGRPSGTCCLVLDVRLEDCDGIAVHEQLVRSGIHIPTIFVTGYGDIPSTVRAMKSGAVDFLPKPFEPDQLVSCVLAALEADERSRATKHYETEMRERYASLTPREREVFADVASGKLNKQVAYDYGISERTVKVHRARVMEKMEAETFAGLVRMADVLQLSCHTPHRSTSPVG